MISVSGGCVRNSRSSWSPRRITRLAVLTIALTASTGLSLAGCTTHEDTASPAPANAAATSAVSADGPCRLASAAEIAQITGISTIKPTPVAGDPNVCEYFYDLNATIPTWSPGTPASDIEVPPSVYIAFFTDAVGIDGVTRDLSGTDFVPLPGVGVKAGWDDELGDLAVDLQHGVARVSVEQPDSGQKLRTNDLKAIAVEVFHVAEPRMR